MSSLTLLPAEKRSDASRKPSPTGLLQCRPITSATPAAAPPIVHDALRSPGQPLDAATRAYMEPRFGHDFSKVRVHADGQAAESTRAVNALAYTAGSNIVFGRNAYAPHSETGRKLIAHELTHVIQQSRASTESAGLPVGSAHDGAEGEAERSARAVIAGAHPTITYSPVSLRRQVLIFVGQRRRVANGSVSPGPGISISWSGNSVTIAANLQISGPAATQEVANQMKATIERVWNASFPDGYRVSCQANVSYRTPGSPEDGNATQIEVYPGGANSTSYVQRSWLVGARYLKFYLSNNLDWTPAHEFGHLLGLDDRYSEGIISRINMLLDRPRETTVDVGWEGNLMAVDHGALQSKNIRDLLEMYAYEVVPLGMPARSEPTEA
jgi:hypothetical protein